MRNQMKRLCMTGSLVLAAQLAPGCVASDGEPGTYGQFGRVTFAYDQSCFFECPIEQPLLVGARETIVVTGPGDDADVTAATPDDDIVDLATEHDCHCERIDGNPGQLEIADEATCKAPWRKRCDTTVLVEAKAVGTARLELRRGKQLVDATDLLVREADRAVFFATYADRLGTLEADELALEAGERLDLRVELYDTEGLALLAPEGVTWRVGDDAVAIVTAWLIGSGAEVEAGLGVAIEAKAEGTTDVSVDVPGLEASIPLTVTAR